VIVVVITVLDLFNTIMDTSHTAEKKSTSRRVPRKKTTPGHRIATLVAPPEAKAVDDRATRQEPVIENHPNPSGFAEASASKKLKKQNMSAFYIIECVVEGLVGDVNVCFFKNPARPNRETYEPFTVPFRSVFKDRLEEDLGVVSIGARCDSNHRFIANKNGADPDKMEYGWSLFVNDTAADPGDWAIELCRKLNTDEAYLNSFDLSRTSGKPPRFQVLDDVTQEPRRKLDQVMMDEGIAKFVIKKHNLKDYAVRRRLKTDEAWHELLHPYFQDFQRGRLVVEDYLRAQTGLTKSTS